MASLLFRPVAKIIIRSPPRVNSGIRETVRCPPYLIIGKNILVTARNRKAAAGRTPCRVIDVKIIKHHRIYASPPGPNVHRVVRRNHFVIYLESRQHISGRKHQTRIGLKINNPVRVRVGIIYDDWICPLESTHDPVANGNDIRRQKPFIQLDLSANNSEIVEAGNIKYCPCHPFVSGHLAHDRRLNDRASGGSVNPEDIDGICGGVDGNNRIRGYNWRI